jgi:hypothetical protein
VENQPLDAVMMEDGRVSVSPQSFRFMLDCLQAALFLNDAPLNEHPIIRVVVNNCWHDGMDIIEPIGNE